MDDYTRAMRLIVRLQQPNREFKHVAAQHKMVIRGLDHCINFTKDVHIKVVEVL